MLKDQALKFFERIRIISVARLAHELGTETGEILKLIPEWENENIVRVVNGGGCASCGGCGSGCSGDTVSVAPSENTLLISAVKKIQEC